MNPAKKSTRKIPSFIPLFLMAALLLTACGGGSNRSVTSQTDNQTPTILDAGPPGITLLAGTLGGAGDDDGIGSQARFNNIKNFTTDISGNLYVTTSDRNSNGLQAIRKVTPDGLVTTLFSSQAGNVDGDRAIAKISNPGQIAVDSKANVYFIDDNGVRVLANNGVLTTLMPLNKVCPGDMFRCEGFIRIFKDVLFVFDGNVVYKFDQDGRKVIFAGQRDETTRAIDGTGTASSFNHIVAVNVESDRGFILFDHGKLRRLSANAEVMTVADGDNIILRGCVEKKLSLYSEKDIRFIFTCSDAPSPFRGFIPFVGQFKLSPSGKFELTSDFTLLPNGNLGYWPEKTYSILRNEIWFKDAAGKERLFAGLNDENVLKDGNAGEARFKDPQAIAADMEGNVYVAENPDRKFENWQGGYWNISVGLTIRKVTREGTVTTLSNPTTPAGNISGIAVDRKGNIYASSTQSSSSFFPGIYKITPTGIVTVFAGAGAFENSPTTIEARDGLAEQARFTSSLSLLGFDREGNLYANDREGDKATLRKITPTGLVSTISALPTGFGADELGNIYSIGTDKTSILRTGVDQKVTIVAGAVDNHSLKLGALPGQLSHIRGLARTGPRSFAVLNDVRILRLVIP
jgi:hypothetical protein